MPELLTYLESDNIAEFLDQDTLSDIGQQVIRGYEDDLASRSDWEQRNKDYIKLATQVREKKDYPWPNAANIKYPLLTEASIQFAARATAALIPGTDIVRAFAVGEDPQGLKNERATRISKHMSWQILEQMEDWEEDQDRLLHILPIIGCAFKKTYYDPIKRKNVSELVLPDNLVVNYWAKGIESAWRVSQVLDLSQNDIHSYEASGLFLENNYQSTVPSPTPHQDQSQSTTPQSNYDDSTPVRFIEQHTFFDLDQDGYAEPYVVTVDLATENVVRIVARYDEEGVQYDDEDNVIRVEPVQYFTKYGFIPNPDGGFYDVGYGLLLTGINETVNTVTNLLLDAGHMATTGGGFLGRGIKLEGGNYSFRPNEWKQVRGTGSEIKNSIVPLPVREPSPVLFNLLGLMIQSAQRIAGTVDSMMGENPGQNQKATTTQITVEQGMKVFNGLYKRTHRSMKKEFQKLFRLNRLYLEPEEYFNVLDPYKPEVQKVMLEDYQDKIDIVPTADPNISSEQMAAMKNQQLLQMLPMGLNQAEVTKRVLESGKHYGIERLLQPNPPAPPPLEQIQFQDESEREWAKIRIEALKVKDQRLLDQAKAIKEIATAEAQKTGVQMNALMGYLDRLEADMVRDQQEASSIGEQNANNAGPTPPMA